MRGTYRWLVNVEDFRLIARLLELLVPTYHHSPGYPCKYGSGNAEGGTASHRNGISWLIALGPEVRCPCGAG